MASDAEAQLDLLDELLNDVAGEAQTHQGEESVDDNKETPCVEGGEEEMSAEDVLQQLDNVTLPLDGGGDGTEADEAEAKHDPVLTEEEKKTDENATTDAMNTAPSAIGELATTEERDLLMVDPVDEEAALSEAGEDHQEEEFADASEVPVAFASDDTSLGAQADAMMTGTDEAEHAPEAAAASEGEMPIGLKSETPPLDGPPDTDTELTVADGIEQAPQDVATRDRGASNAQEEVAEEVAVGGLVEEEVAESAVKDAEKTAAHEIPDDRLLVEASFETIDEPTFPTQNTVEVAASGSRDSSSRGSWEAVVLPPTEGIEDPVDGVQPPPAPSCAMPSGQPMFSGSLNPGNLQVVTDGGDTGTGAATDDPDDSDSDDDDDEGAAPPPLLPIDSVLSDEEEELEVDVAVAEEILAGTKKKDPTGAVVSTTPFEEPTDSPSNPLLDALGTVDLVPKSIGEIHDPSKTDGISLGFDDAVEVRSAQVIAPPVVHPESSVAAFGIGYQSMRKRPDPTATTGDDAYSIAKGPTFQELEREVTLVSDASLSSKQRQDDPTVETEDDEFDSFPDAGSAASPTRVDTILQKRRASFATKSAEEVEAALVAELKKATVHEKQHLHDSDDAAARDTNRVDGDNALTLKELHSMYKRGLGDQEVRMLEDEDDTTTRSSAYDTTAASANEMPTSVGGLLSKPALTAHAIAEEGEEADEEQEHEIETLNDEDADAVTMNSERMTFDDQRSIAPPQGPDATATTSDWKEIQLAPATSGSSATQKSAQTAMADANAGSKISYAEALQYFLESDDVLVHRDRIIAEEKPPSASCFSCFSRPRLTYGGAIEQRDRLFCVAATSFDARNPVHVRMLQTIYRRLANSSSSRDVPLMGHHWETIGFQGSDPSTDLRGCGVLSLLQMLHVVESHTEFARRFHSVSQHPVRHFPLACAMINITLQCLVALRSGALYKESNKRSSVFEAANVLHVAIATQLMKEIQSSSEEVPLVMKRVLDNGRLNPDRAIEAHASSRHALTPPSGASGKANHQQQSSRKSSAAAAGRASSSHAAAEFTEIGLHSVGDEA